MERRVIIALDDREINEMEIVLGILFLFFNRLKDREAQPYIASNQWLYLFI